MFSLAYVVHLFPHEFACLRRGSFALAPITPGPFESLPFRHNASPTSECSRVDETRTGQSHLSSVSFQVLPFDPPSVVPRLAASSPYHPPDRVHFSQKACTRSGRFLRAKDRVRVVQIVLP